MVDRLNYKIKLLVPLSLAGVLFSMIGIAQITDPTRPPLVSKDAATDNPVINQGPALQSIIVSEGYKAAIISGKKVVLGANYGNAKLVQINETSVVLKTDTSTQVLKLFPGVEKVPAKESKKVSGKAEQSSENKLMEKK